MCACVCVCVVFQLLVRPTSSVSQHLPGHVITLRLPLCQTLSRTEPRLWQRLRVSCHLMWRRRQEEKEEKLSSDWWGHKWARMWVFKKTLLRHTRLFWITSFFLSSAVGEFNSATVGVTSPGLTKADEFPSRNLICAPLFVFRGNIWRKLPAWKRIWIKLLTEALIKSSFFWDLFHSCPFLEMNPSRSWGTSTCTYAFLNGFGMWNVRNPHYHSYPTDENQVAEVSCSSLAAVHMMSLQSSK